MKSADQLPGEASLASGSRSDSKKDWGYTFNVLNHFLVVYLSLAFYTFSLSSVSTDPPLAAQTSQAPHFSTASSSSHASGFWSEIRANKLAPKDHRTREWKPPANGMPIITSKREKTF